MTAPDSAALVRRSDSDAAYAEAKALIEQYVGNPDAQFEIKRALIQYAKLCALESIENVRRDLLGGLEANDNA